MRRFRVVAIFVGCLVPMPTVEAAEPVRLQNGDRVVLLGNTLIEREQRTGYWELALTIANPGKNVIFRNLGWSGDTVWGEARGRFGGPTEGFRHLKDHVLALKPTVIVLGYGFNESFAGPDGVEPFRKGLDKLLDVLAPTKARIVMLAPMDQERLPPPLPDPTAQNKNIELYRKEIERTAAQRGLMFVNPFERTDQQPWTDNGIHLTDLGYWTTGRALAKALGSEPVVLDLDAKGASNPTWTIALHRLPDAPAPGQNGRLGGRGRVRVTGLPPGKYVLPGKEVQGSGTANDWAKGLDVAFPADTAQVEQLRAAIVAKNLLYFHRWRPQNETYLFLFRKNEQGKNAKEIPEFDPLIEKLEAEIARLRVPTRHEYRLELEKGDK